jgi:hypothetical protein
LNPSFSLFTPASGSVIASFHGSFSPLTSIPEPPRAVHDGDTHSLTVNVSTLPAFVRLSIEPVNTTPLHSGSPRVEFLILRLPDAV